MQEWEVTQADAGLRLDQWLAQRAPGGSRRRAAEWLDRGKVFVNQESVGPAQASLRVESGWQVGLWMDRPGSARSVDRQVVRRRHLLSLLHVDRALVVVNKPPGLLVEPLPGKASPEVTVLDLVNDQLRHEAAAPCQVVHRIDRDTSGLVLLARTSAARDFLKEQFADHLPERVYQALVLGVPQPGAGVWHDRLAWDGDSLRQRRAHGTDARAKDARCRYRVVEALGDVSRLEVSLITGKRNQIRVQAGLRGHALVGEQQYRFATPEEPPDLPSLRRQALHAWRLAFVHPATREACRFEAPWPVDFAGVLEALRRRHQTASGAVGNGG